ncbi:MAG TPA: hypothetical protein VGM53_10605 [Streptosporangiaceae bacterium]|jgi:uncharacterized protein YukE
MALVGADLAQLDNLVKQLAGPMKSQLDGVLNQMNSQVQASSSYWVAQHGDKFRSDFAQFVQKANSQLTQILEEASAATGKNLSAISGATGNAV